MVTKCFSVQWGLALYTALEKPAVKVFYGNSITSQASSVEEAVQKL